LLDPKKEEIKAILMSFREPYPSRFRELEEELKIRLGKGERLVTNTHEGQLWRSLEYRIELRRDRKSGDLELLFHRRGAAKLLP